MGSPPFQKHLFSTPFLCPALFRVLNLCQRVHKKKKKPPEIAPQKKKKKRYRTTLSASRILKSPLSLSLSAFIKPLLWKKANPKRSSEEEEEEEEEEEGVRRRRRLRRPFRFVERRRKSARERILFCVVRGVREDSNSNSGIKTISGDSHFSLAIISIERFGRVGTRSVRRETAVFCVCAL